MFTRWDQTEKPEPKTILETGRFPLRQAGFTLIEVVVAMVILMVLLGLAAVSFRGLGLEQDLTREAAAIQRLAQKARLTAITDGRPIILELRRDLVLAPGRELKLPQSQLEIRRWGSSQWGTAAGFAWRFEPNGICEPISLRILQGKASYEMTFHPLTALAVDEQLWIP